MWGAALFIPSSDPAQLHAEQLDAPPCQLGESPRWDGRFWWWVDALAGTIWKGTSDSKLGVVAEEFWSPGGRISVVHPAEGGGVLAVALDELVHLDEAGSVVWRLPLPKESDEVFNDGIAAADGALWIGTVRLDQAADGALLRVDATGGVTRFRTGTQLSNGITWLDESTFLHVDSRERTISSRGVNECGSGFRDHGQVPLGDLPPDAMPDGIALDAEGGLWVALYGAGEVRRYVDGCITHVARVPALQSTAVALGGEDGRDLLITSAQEGFSAQEARDAPHAGRLFLARVKVPGRPSDNALVTPAHFDA